MRKTLLTLLGAAFVCACAIGSAPAFADDDDRYYAQHREQYISREQARDIAVRAVGGGTVIEVEFDRDHNGDHFDAEVRGNDGREYDVKIDAKSGEILSSQADR